MLALLHTTAFSYACIQLLQRLVALVLIPVDACATD